MSAQFYDNALRLSYSVDLIDVAATGVEGGIIGPEGKVGQVVGLTYSVTTVNVGTAAVISVGNNAAALPYNLTVAAAAALDSAGAAPFKSDCRKPAASTPINRTDS